MPSEFYLELVTPKGVFFENNVHMIIASTIEGEIGVLKGHEPLVAPLAVGSVRIYASESSEPRLATIEQGFIFVKKDKVTLVSDRAEWADEIDLQEAETEYRELKDNEYDNEKDKIQRLRLIKSANRINVAKRSKSI